MIDKTRLEEMLTLISYILPISEDKKEAIEGFFGKGFYSQLPIFLRGFGQALMQYPEESQGYLEFFKQAISYANCETNEYPEVEGGAEKIRKIIQIQMSNLPQAEKIKKIKELDYKTPYEL